MADQPISVENVRTMLTESLARVRTASDQYFQLLEKGMSSSQLPIAESARPFTELMQRNVAATFDLCDKLIKAENPQDAARIQSEFLQSQMRAMADQARTLGESAMKTMTGAFTRRS